MAFVSWWFSLSWLWSCWWLIFACCWLWSRLMIFNIQLYVSLPMWSLFLKCVSLLWLLLCTGLLKFVFSLWFVVFGCLLCFFLAAILWILCVFQCEVVYLFVFHSFCQFAFVLLASSSICFALFVCLSVLSILFFQFFLFFQICWFLAWAEVWLTQH